MPVWQASVSGDGRVAYEYDAEAMANDPEFNPDAFERVWKLDRPPDLDWVLRHVWKKRVEGGLGDKAKEYPDRMNSLEVF